MANNVEWSYAGILPAVADDDDLPMPNDPGEIAVWLGSDGANVLYGTPDTLREWATALLALIPPEA